MASIEERFWARVKKTADCWEWTGSKSSNGYGLFMQPPSRIRAHRFAYSMLRGEIPRGKWVLHRCDNRACVNPDHLFIGDNTANVRDMHRKGRGWGGIGPETAYAILWRWASGVPYKQIAAEHGVSYSVVQDIAQRRSWKSLSDLHD